MSTPFQNRLVGTIIVAAAAIIFLPDIFDGEKQTHQADFEDIPQAPKFSSTLEKKPFPNDKLNKLPVQSVSDETALDDENENTATNSESDGAIAKVETLTKPEPFASTTTDKKPKQQVETKQETTSTKSNDLPEKAVAEQAWVIQLGSFRHKKNVQDLANKLKQNGYTVFTKPIKTKSGTLTKVFVGPELSKKTLEKKLPKLKELTKVQGKIARFSPTK